MARRHNTSEYFADDKDIVDLMSEKAKSLSVQRLLQIARTLGLVISPLESRKKVIEILSWRYFDWTELSEFLNKAMVQERTNNQKSSKVSTNAKQNDITEILQIMKDKRSKHEGEVWDINVRDNGRIDINIDYEEIDPGKTRLSQKKPKSASIEFIPTEDGFDIIQDSGSKTSDVIDVFMDNLNKDKEIPSLKTEIELDGINDPDTRTSFFLNLIEGLEGFKKIDVTRVKIERKHELEDENDDDMHDDPSNMNSSEQEIVGLLNNATMTGTQLLNSKQYLQMKAENYFINSISWLAEELSEEGRLVNFSAEFKDINNAKDFNFTVGPIQRKKQDSFEHKKQKTKAQPYEQSSLGTILMKSAYKAMNNAIDL